MKVLLMIDHYSRVPTFHPIYSARYLLTTLSS